MIKYTAALRYRTADPEAILRRFASAAVQHPTYAALAELGKVAQLAGRRRNGHNLERTVNAVAYSGCVSLRSRNSILQQINL